MKTGLFGFKANVDLFDQKVRAVSSNFLLLSNEGCGRGETYTYPQAECRFPDLLHHSIEGYGFLVNDLAIEAGVQYNYGANTVTFFARCCFVWQKVKLLLGLVFNSLILSVNLLFSTAMAA